MNDLITGLRSNMGKAIYVELNRAIQSEYTSLLYYQKLEELAPASHKKHYHMNDKYERQRRLSVLVRHYFATIGCYPLFDKVAFPVEYIEGLENSLDHSLNIVTMYSELIYSIHDVLIQQELLRAVNCEMAWATRVNFLYANMIHISTNKTSPN